MKQHSVCQLSGKLLHFKLRLVIMLVFMAFMSSVVSGITITTLSDGSSEKDLAFSESEVQIVYLKIPKNAHVISAYLNLSGLGYECYQESANISTACGGLDTGTYQCDGSWETPCSNAYDGDWNTYALSDVAPGWMYINYTKPLNFTSAIWQVKDGQHDHEMVTTTNLAVPQDCFKQDPLQFRVHTFYMEGWYANWECYNGSEWKILRGVGSYPEPYTWFVEIYEEAIIWIGYPKNCYLEVGTPDGVHEWSYSGIFDQNDIRTEDFSEALNFYLLTCSPDANGYCEVPLLFQSETAGIIRISNINIRATSVIHVDDDAPDDPCHGNPDYSDPDEDGSTEHPFDAIQEAIDVATDGDTVIVLQGAYTGTGNRDIDFNGKAITVRSLNGPETCIIDCQGTQSEPHRGFHFHSGEGMNSILSGFLITNGYGPYEQHETIPLFSTGGAIRCEGSNPLIKDCIISNNWAEVAGGMFNKSANPTLINCDFKKNVALYIGAGMYNAYSNPTLVNCAFHDNSAPMSPGGRQLTIWLPVHS